MARSSGTLVPGQRLNPSGLAGPERRISRSVSEALRGLMSDEDFGRALLAIAAGVDPFAKERAMRPDGLPQLGEGPIDWAHRMAAIKMYAEYSRGKPTQGVVVQAEIDARIAVEGRIETGPVDFRSMPPEVRAALRLAAAAALGRPLPAPAEPRRMLAPRALDVQVDAEKIQGEACKERAILPPADALTLEGGPGSTVELDVEEIVHVPTHALTVEHAVSAVKPIHLDFRTSGNLVDAELADGICTVRFRGSDGSVARTYRYANVTPAMMTAWGAAPSAGAWFAREIKVKPLKYPVLTAPTRVPGVVL